MPLFYGVLMLTFVNLLLRFAGTAFQVWISGRIGAAGVGILQLVLSVGNFSLVAGMAGVRTAAMYLTAAEMNKPDRLPRVLSSCFTYSILCSTAAGAILFFFAPGIASRWIGVPETEQALRLMAGFLPSMCLTGVLSGYFTALNRIGTLAAVEVLEQILSMGVTVLLLTGWAGGDTGKICCAVVGGSCLGGLVTLLLLNLLRRHRVPGPAFRTGILNAAVPLAAADLLRTGISTTESLMVPGRLGRLYANPLAVFGLLTGMVFPILMFPACILYGLGELLIPELARCKAAGSRGRISYLAGKSLRMTFLYGIFCTGVLWLLAEPLCSRFYESSEAGSILRRYAPLVPMLYCDAVVDAMTKGLGQQKVCVRYNILTNSLDVGLLFLLLPIFGMKGYFFSFFLTHLLNFFLSIRRLLQITGLSIPLSGPLLTALMLWVSLWLSGFLPGSGLQLTAFLCLLGSLLTLLGVTGKEDLLWLLSLIQKRRPAKAGRLKG